MPPDWRITNVLNIVTGKQEEAQPTQTDLTARKYQKLFYLDTTPRPSGPCKREEWNGSAACQDW